MITLPSPQIDGHQRDPDPRADDDENDPEVIISAADQRRIEGVENRGATQRHGHRRHDGADKNQTKADPRPARSDQRALQRRLADRISETHRDQGWEDVSHHGSVLGHGPVIPFRVAYPAAEGAAHPHLPGAEKDRESEHGEREPKMCEYQPLATQHSSASSPSPPCP